MTRDGYCVLAAALAVCVLVGWCWHVAEAVATSGRIFGHRGR